MLLVVSVLIGHKALMLLQDERGFSLSAIEIRDKVAEFIKR